MLSKLRDKARFTLSTICMLFTLQIYHVQNWKKNLVKYNRWCKKRQFEMSISSIYSNSETTSWTFTICKQEMTQAGLCHRDACTYTSKSASQNCLQATRTVYCWELPPLFLFFLPLPFLPPFLPFLSLFSEIIVRI